MAGDNNANVQAAIDKVSALQPDKNGFRGAILLRAGYYKMAAPRKIQASGIVLRGEGMGRPARFSSEPEIRARAPVEAKAAGLAGNQRSSA